jgi:hypothetical protein
MAAPVPPEAPAHKMLRMIMSTARVVEMMERAYPQRVAAGKMSQEAAEHEITAQKDVLAYLQQAKAALDAAEQRKQP